ncbi:uncharacterized protein LOC123872071 [Maniola jurtina]|uniref:uncharacterized protein LOC123872071 n=1 Tax=Maniola jurtina TaxID=191418 RepID=UPI001E688D3F|nr:uncharacterized protein LOC123872071 [Maniola jurtina]
MTNKTKTKLTSEEEKSERGREEDRRDGSRTRSPLFRAPSGLASESDSEGSRTSSRTGAASRGRSSARGRSTGIAKARAELREAKEEAREVQFNQYLRDRVYRKETPAVVSDPEEVPQVHVDDPSKLSADELRALGDHNVANIIQVATKSGNLKGTWVKRLKDAANKLQEVVDTLAARTVAEETRRLRTDNDRLRSEVETLKNELKAHRREFSDMRASMAAAAKGTPAPSLSGDLIEELKASIVSSVGLILDARFAGIEERLLPERVHRPPLSSDRKRSRVSASQPAASSVAAPNEPETRDTMTDPSPAGTTESAAGPSHSQPTANDWATVVKRRGKRKKVPAPVASTATPAANSAKPAKPRLASPKTAAVVITLQPEAAERGVTYSQVLERAEQSVDLQEFGIAEGMRISRAATGARLLELPRNQTQEQAELLASRLRTALDGIASVVRPSQSATLRVTGLDDSVTKEKVASAVARVGNCAAQSIRVGEVQTGPRGMGWVTVHCPVEAAKVLSDAGKLRVGWSSAEVRVLERRPLRCYKCLGIGHTRPVCPSTVDRGNLCFRCGCDGHKSLACSREIRCAVCADAGLPANHIMGGKNCSPPHTKGGPVPGNQSTVNAGRDQTQEGSDMIS